MGKFVRTNAGYIIGTFDDNHAKLLERDGPGQTVLSAGWFVVPHDGRPVKLLRDWSSSLKASPSDADVDGLSQYFGLPVEKED